MTPGTDTTPFGMIAEFDDPAALLSAAKRARDAGYTKMDAYTPFPIDGLDEAVGFRKTRLPILVFLGGLGGAAAGFGMQWFSAVVHYPINIGGRPMNSWPAFVPIMFELTVLGAAFAAVMGMLALNGLPRPHHPLFNHERFELASRTHFFLAIESEDERFDAERTRRFMESLGAHDVAMVHR